MGLGTNGEDTAITRAIVSMAHSLGVRALAEGVETEAQLVALQEVGCDLGQGFYWSPSVENRELFAGGESPGLAYRNVPFEVSLAGIADAVRLSLRAMRRAGEPT